MAASAVAATLAFTPAAWARLDLLDQPARLTPRASQSVLLAVTHAGPRLVAVGEAGIVLLSDDNGRTWRQTGVPVSVTLTHVFFISAKDGWAVGHSGVVLHTSDGGQTWLKQLDGRQAAQLELASAQAEGDPRRVANAQRLVADGPDKPFFDVYFSDENNGFAVGAYGFIVGTRDGGKTWLSLMGRLDNPKGKHLYKIFATASGLYLAGEQGALYRSGDAGQHFVEVTTPYAGTYFDLVVSPKEELVALGLRGNAYRTGDGGATWSKVDTGTSATLTAGARLSDGSLVMVDETGRLLRSVDGGRAFTPVAIPRPSSFTGIAQAADGAVILSGAGGITRVPAHAIGAESNK
ncbi:BNR repeat protein (plasmid) [Cupriavidus necator H850]|uniref:WD40/YVTN/BNR-like repeat-containing protein n=1 Tax=Cupriavidus necator TaxID=106590 RepID=UPI001E5FCEC3|nr:YCF48-related protein [Cupriavidus necator]KAI3605945.1 BNR repeat protein [Cupriavidus necator H850]